MVDPKKLREMRRYLYEQNKRYSPWRFVCVPQSEWPTVNHQPDAVYRSRDFLVLIFFNPGEPTRLSICRTELDNEGRWKDGITWDELQHIKTGVGYGISCTIEIYPPDKNVVNVANMRHLWIYDAPFRWRNEKAGQGTTLPGAPLNQPTEETHQSRMNREKDGNQGDSPWRLASFTASPAGQPPSTR